MCSTPTNGFCAGGADGAESDDPDTDDAALKKARDLLQPSEDQNAFAMSHFNARRHVSSPWLYRPGLNALIGERGSLVSRWLLRGCFFWDPITQYARWFVGSPIPCSKEGCTGVYEPIGTFSTKSARFVHTLSDGFYIYRFRYVCSRRKDKVMPRKSESNSDSPYVMALYPDPVRSANPAAGTNQTQYSVALLPWLRRYHASMDGNATSFRAALSESRSDFWYRRCLLYLESFDLERERRGRSKVEKAGGFAGLPGLWHPPPYDPSRYFWVREYLRDFEMRRGALEKEIQGVHCREVLRVDHTGGAARRMRNAGGKWVANIMNEDNMIAGFGLVPSDAKSEIKSLVIGIRDRHVSEDVPMARVVYVDKN